MRWVLVLLGVLVAGPGWAQGFDRAVQGRLATGAGPCGSAQLSPCWLPSAVSQSMLNITSATNVKPNPGWIGKVCLNVAGGTASYVIDSTGTSQSAGNTILTLPSSLTAGTCVTVDWPALVGISIVPGTSAVLSVSYE